MFRFFFFFFNDTATTEIYTLSLHDALPISLAHAGSDVALGLRDANTARDLADEVQSMGRTSRSEEHTSELQSQSNLVCRLLLEKKKKQHFHKPRRQDNLPASPCAPYLYCVL